jgi:hypothetical protein
MKLWYNLIGLFKQGLPKKGDLFLLIFWRQTMQQTKYIFVKGGVVS